MRTTLRGFIVFLVLFAVAASGACAAAPKARTLTCVGIYSETDAGQVSYRVGTGAWVVIKVGDKIPADAEIKVNVERDWIEVIPTGNPNEVYEITGPESGEIIKTVAEILKGKPKVVSFPKGTKAKPDPKFKDKLVVTQYLGRQVYTTSDGDDKDIKYGDVLAKSGSVRIIAINNTLTLMNATGAVTTIIGPLNFNVEQVLLNKKLYKYLNVLQ
jgi:hypothetical protein